MGLPIAHGIPVAVDATLVSPIHANGTPWRGAADRPGVSFRRAERSKQNTYPELVGSDTIRLVTAAAEIGGRLNHGAHELLDAAAAAKASTEPKVLRKHAARAWRARWVAMVSISIQSAMAASLVDTGLQTLDAPEGTSPPGVEVWLDQE